MIDIDIYDVYIPNANVSKNKTTKQNTHHSTQTKFPLRFCLNTKAPLQLHRHVPFLRAAGRRHSFGHGRGKGQEQLQEWQRRRGSRHGIGEEVVQASDLKKFGCFFFFVTFFVGWLLLVGCWLLMYLFCLPLMATFFSVKVCVFCWGEGHSKSSQVVLGNHFNTSRHESIIQHLRQ